MGDHPTEEPIRYAVESRVFAADDLGTEENNLR